MGLGLNSGISGVRGPDGSKELCALLTNSASPEVICLLATLFNEVLLATGPALLS